VFIIKCIENRYCKRDTISLGFGIEVSKEPGNPSQQVDACIKMSAKSIAP